MKKVAQEQHLFANQDQKRHLRGATRIWTATKKKAIRRRDEEKCVYCGNPGTVIDHVIPARFGGPTITANGVLSCRSCNFDKSAVIEFGRLTYAFGHLVRAGEDMSWVADFWKGPQKLLDDALLRSMSMPAGERWALPSVQAKYDQAWQTPSLVKARAAIGKRLTGLAKIYAGYPDLERFVQSQRESNLPISVGQMMSQFDMPRQTAYRLSDELVGKGEWREKLPSDDPADPFLTIYPFAIGQERRKTGVIIDAAKWEQYVELGRKCYRADPQIRMSWNEMAVACGIPANEMYVYVEVSGQADWMWHRFGTVDVDNILGALLIIQREGPREFLGDNGGYTLPPIEVDWGDIDVSKIQTTASWWLE